MNKKSVLLFSFMLLFFSTQAFATSLVPLCGATDADSGGVCWNIFADTETVGNITTVNIYNNGDINEGGVVAVTFPVLGDSQEILEKPIDWDILLVSGPDFFGTILYSLTDILVSGENLHFEFSNFPETFSFAVFDIDGSSMSIGPASVPEPSTLLLLTLGFFSLFFVKKPQKYKI